MKKALCLAFAGAFACTDIPTDPQIVLSLEVDSLAPAAVVAGDSLRDSAGLAVPVKVRAFNYQGELITGPSLRFRALDRGLTVDSVTGFVTGDSVRTAPARVTVSAGEIRATVSIDVVPQPDSLTPVVALDSLRYSLVDSTRNTSAPLSVRVVNTEGADPVPVRSWIISFALQGQSGSQFATFVNAAGRPTTVATTTADGLASIRVRIDVTRLVAVVDSVELQATAKYRGVHLGGSPARLVLVIQPATP